MANAQERVAPLVWVKQHFWSLLLLAVLLAASVTAVHWWKRAHPGAMSVLEAQAMDMTVMKPPVGSVPVAAEEVRRGPFAAKVTYTGTVAPYMEQNVYPRVEGWLTELSVYNGDQVRAGQLLARIDSPDLATRLSEAAAGEVAAQRDVPVAQAETARSRAEIAAAQAELAAAESDVEGARAEVQAADRGVRLAESEVSTARASLEQAKKELVSAQADLKYWQAEIKREKALLHTGAVSQQEYDSELAHYTTADANVASANAKVDQMEAGVAAAEARVEQAESQVDASKAALTNRTQMAEAARQRIDAARAGLEGSRSEVSRRAAMAREASARTRTAAVIDAYREVRAPFGGMVTKRLIHPGVLVNPGMAILNVVQIDEVRLQANVAEQDLARIRIGAAVSARPFKDGDQQAIHASVTSISPLADPVSRTSVVEAIVPNPGHRLLPGDFVTLDISTSEDGDAVTVPNRALVQRDDRSAVWTVVSEPAKGKVTYFCTMHPEVISDKPGKCPKCHMDLVPRTSVGGERAHLVFVTLGDTDGERTEVLEGLKEGDRVIYAGHTDLKEGDQVFPTEWGANGPKALPPAPGGGMNMPGHGNHGGGEMNMEQHPAHGDGDTEHPGAEMKMDQHPARGDGHGERAQPAPEPTPKTKADATEKVVYTCPMDPDVISDKPGDCPKCGMRLEPKQTR
jgi:multidrug efflux pump subunit AcrA (membrane-fusion protein)